MAYITESFLRSYAYDSSVEYSAESLQKTHLFSSSTKRIFLSHSHKDQVLAKGLKNYLQSLGIDLYIDWLDSSMPAVTSRDTATQLKKRIKDSHHVLVLATDSAINSRWVPWEIGVADIEKTPDGISIMPVVDAYGNFHGSEYLQLYRKIDISQQGTIAVFEPNAYSGKTLQDFLRTL